MVLPGISWPTLWQHMVAVCIGFRLSGMSFSCFVTFCVFLPYYNITNEALARKILCFLFLLAG